jgi:asparagine synthase (glutamine-hydrolysing)
MCGICGTINFKDNAIVDGMLGRMVCRGPDDTGIWHEGIVCLGHTRLAIIDTSAAGHQPMSNEDGSMHITYNGEIYNFQVLKKELIELGHRFRSHTDTEVIIHLYEEFGERCLDKLRGMFSFAIWDSRSNKLFAARDRFGIKPFFYCSNGGKFIFSSELKPILSSGVIHKSINLNAARHYFDYGCVQAPETMIEGVSQLESAHYLVFENGRITKSRYWEPSYSDHLGALKKEEEYIYEIKSLLDESVRMRMVSDVPVGAFLSGGIDSSAITALMQKNSSNPIKTFSVVFEERDYDEREFSNSVARALGTDHRQVSLKREDIMKTIPAIFDAMDEPSIDGFNTFIISKAVKDAGIKVALSGLGGDELFAGYPSFRRLPKIAAILKFASIFPENLRKILFNRLRSIAKTRKELKLYFSFLECSNMDELYMMQRSVFLPHEVREILPLADSQGISPHIRARYTAADLINQLSLLELNGYLQNMLLKDTDRMSMANSIEIRVPFLDHLLVEKVLQIPGKLKVGGNYPKRLLAEAMKDLLPNDIYDRPKMGFVLPFESWMRGGLKDYFEATFAVNSLKSVNILDRDKISRIWKSFLEGTELYNYSSILCLASFINWYKKNIV